MRDLILDDLTKRFGQAIVAVDSVRLEIAPGSMVGIIGRSGAGKSTLLRMINRLVDPTSGVVRFGELDVTSLRGRRLLAWRARCAMIFQQFGLVRRSTVLENVLHGRLHAKSSAAAALGFYTRGEREEAVGQLARFEMEEFALQRVQTLSGGQQQRVAIARALMQRPHTLLADEPVASLDPRSTIAVMDALAEISRRDGITVICNIHDVDLARRYFPRIVGMRRGAVVFDGPTRDLTDARAAEIYDGPPAAAIDREAA